MGALINATLKMKQTMAMFLFMGLSLLPAQAQLDNYKYFVVPKRFETFKDVNQYQTSTLVKFLLTRYAFDPIYDDAIPEELFLDKCLGLITQLEDNSTYLQTVVAIVFYDCRGQEVFRTQEGSSKNKEFKEAYSEAIQKAMSNMALISHNYQGSEEETVEEPVVTQAPDPVEIIPEPETEVAPVEPAAVAVIVEEISEPSVKEETVSEASEATKPKITQWEQIARDKGYVLTQPGIDVSWVFMQTSSLNVFLALSKNIQGIAFIVDEGWRVEYYLGDVLQAEIIEVKD